MKNTTVTEAHYALRREVIFSAPDEGAQLIASSEAKAVGPHAHVAAQLAAVLTECGAPEFANSEHALQWAKGIAQLRAELALLREWQREVIQNANAHHAEREDAIARAELAEASLHALRLVCGTTDADKFSTWVDRANARAERAEADADSTRERALTLANSLDEAQAELAAERARLDYMSNCGFEHLHNETGDHLGHEWTISSYGGSHDVTLRDVIDAEMKEEAK